VSATLAQVRKGEVEVRMVNSGLGKVTNRLVEAVLVSPLFLGSVWLLSNSVPPLFEGYQSWVRPEFSVHCFWAVVLCGKSNTVVDHSSGEICVLR
jgi:hypothetical protein